VASLLVATAAAQTMSVPNERAVAPDYDQHEPEGRVGIGGQVGDPSGVTAKVYRRNVERDGILNAAKAYSFLIAWDLDDFFYVNAHALHEHALEDSPLNYYLGPGLIVGFKENGSNDTEVVAGVSGDFGVNFFTESFEVFLGLTPWFRVFPDPGLHLSGGIGLRFYP
jgi:hypothetical protein